MDTSHRVLSAVLLQASGPVELTSKLLTASESRYSNIERVMLAVLFGLEMFHYYAYGRPVVVESAHVMMKLYKGLIYLYVRSIFILMQAQQECPRYEKKEIRIHPYQPCVKSLCRDGLKRLSSSRILLWQCLVSLVPLTVMIYLHLQSF